MRIGAGWLLEEHGGTRLGVAEALLKGRIRNDEFVGDLVTPVLLEAARIRIEEAWADSALPEDEQIAAAHPTRTGRHDLYAEAMRMVGAKRSKGALVDLVNWLLSDRGNHAATEKRTI